MKKKFILLLILYFLFNISVNLVHPITTNYVNDLNLPKAYFGVFFSLMSLGQVIGAIFWGMLSDKIGRRIPITIGLIGYGFFQFCFGYFNKIAWLILVFRLCGGICSSAPVTLFVSKTLDLTEKKTRTKYLSYMSALNLLGASVGYEIGGSLYTYANLSFFQIFLIQTIYCTLLGLIIFFTLGKDKPEEKEKERAKKFSLKYFKGLSPLIFTFLVGLLILTIGQININKYLDVIVIDKGYSAGNLGHFVMLTGLVGALSNIFIIPLILKIKKIKEEYLIIIFTLISIISVVLTFNLNANFLVLLYTSHMVYIIMKALITPLEQNYISKNAINNFGTIMGARQSMISIGNVLGPLLGAAIYTTGSSLIMNISAILLGIGLIIFICVFIINKGKKYEE